jgi:hypothetical protein
MPDPTCSAHRRIRRIGCRRTGVVVPFTIPHESRRPARYRLQSESNVFWGRNRAEWKWSRWCSRRKRARA